MCASISKKKDYVDILWDGSMPSWEEGFILGNGDLGALMYGNQFELKFLFGKNDCWDARYESDPEADILKHDDLITLIENYGLKDIKRFNITANCQISYSVSKKPIPTKYRVIYQTPAFWLKNEYFRPCPKRVGELVFAGPGDSLTKMKSRLRIVEGVFEVSFEYSPQEKLRLEGFIWAEGNLFCLRYQPEGDFKGPCWLVLRKLPDAVDGSIPDPVLEFPPPGDIVIVSQTIPGDEDTEPFEWSIAGKLPGQMYRIDQRYESFIPIYSDGKPIDFFIAVSTSREHKVKPSRRVYEIVEYAARIGYDALKKSQQEWWDRFWSRSSVTLEDKDLERAWYRDLYMAACNIREGKQAPGLYGNMTVYDGAMWHGDYHMNKDFQQPFYPTLVANHPDMLEPYIRAILDYMPTAEWLAEKIFGLEGAYIDLAPMPYVAPYKPNVNNLYGRWLAMTGWAIFPFWWYYRYTLDKKWLAEKGYPAIKKVAQFYWNYLEKYQKRFGGDIYPSNVDERPGWETNSSYDITCFRFAFRAAIESSKVLGVDEECRERWKEGLKRLPEYPTVKINGKEYIALSKEVKGIASGFLIWPSEDLDPSSNSKYVMMVKKALEKIDPEKAGSNMAWSWAPAVARLRIKQAYDCVREAVTRGRKLNGFPSSGDIKQRKNFGLGHYPFPPIVEDVHMPLYICELLLQSYGGIIRLFPAWPRDKSASFESLRAEGGFLVSSSLENGEVGLTKIYSTNGGICKVQWPWGKVYIHCEEDGTEIQYNVKNNIISFETQVGKTYLIKILIEN